MARRTTPNFTPSDDDQIIKGVKACWPLEKIARDVERSPEAVQLRIRKLRSLGSLPALNGRREMFAAPRGLATMPPLTLGADDILVELCIAEGGFPVRVPVTGGVQLMNLAGRPWMHTPEGAEA